MVFKAYSAKTNRWGFFIFFGFSSIISCMFIVWLCWIYTILKLILSSTGWSTPHDVTLHHYWDMASQRRPLSKKLFACYFLILSYESWYVYTTSILASCGLYQIFPLYLGGKILSFWYSLWPFMWVESRNLDMLYLDSVVLGSSKSYNEHTRSYIYLKNQRKRNTSSSGCCTVFLVDCWSLPSKGFIEISNSNKQCWEECV